MWNVDSIFHEKQDGRLCAQHCLNAVLQGQYFSAVDLGELARKLDEDERLRMAESGTDSTEYRRFMEQPSGNMDDTGFFSVQVIGSALRLWNLDLVPYNSSDEVSTRARQDPSNVSAFIFNMEQHWFCIRRFNDVWFNLNSILSKPKFMSSLYLSEYIKQMQEEGYSVFIVVGNFPECPADLVPPVIISEQPNDHSSQIISDSDRDLQQAIEQSLLSSFKPAFSNEPPVNTVDPELDLALRLSMECFGDGSPHESLPSSEETPNNCLPNYNQPT